MRTITASIEICLKKISDLYNKKRFKVYFIFLFYFVVVLCLNLSSCRGKELDLIKLNNIKAYTVNYLKKQPTLFNIFKFSN